MRFLSLTIATLLIIFIVVSCCKTERKQQISLSTLPIYTDSSLFTIEMSPLDTILSDKIADDFSGLVRNNNFSSLIGLDTAILHAQSHIYKILKIDESLVCLTPRKSYTHARISSIIVHFNKNHQIDRYYLLNDYSICDAKPYLSGIVFVATDCGSNNIYWKSKNDIQVFYLDQDFRERFCFRNKRTYAMDAVATLNVKKDKVVVNVGVITGSTMCVSDVTLVINKQGRCIDANSIDHGSCSRALPKELLQEMFIEI